jgi:hypothetical protein
MSGHSAIFAASPAASLAEVVAHDCALFIRSNEYDAKTAKQRFYEGNCLFRGCAPGVTRTPDRRIRNPLEPQWPVPVRVRPLALGNGFPRGKILQLILNSVGAPLRKKTQENAIYLPSSWQVPRARDSCDETPTGPKKTFRLKLACGRGPRVELHSTNRLRTAQPSVPPAVNKWDLLAELLLCCQRVPSNQGYRWRIGATNTTLRDEPLR